MPLESHQVVEEVWDKKKIAIGIGLFIIFVSGALAVKDYFFPTTAGIAGAVATHSAGVKGVQTVDENGVGYQTAKPNLHLPTSDDVQEKILQIQKQAGNINVAEVATSSPQVQDILKQIQALPQVPGAAAKNACMELCKKL